VDQKFCASSTNTHEQRFFEGDDIGTYTHAHTHTHIPYPPQVTGKWSYPLLGSVTVAGSLRVVTPPAPLDSSPSSCSLRSAKPRRVSPSGSSSTSQGSIVTTLSLGTTDTFHGHSNTAYKHYLQEIHPTAATPEYTSFIDEKVDTEEDGVWTTGKV
jgi:hypothetical protein